MTSWHSYPKIYNLGHKLIRDIFSRPVRIEEKVDGSQFSFGVFGGELRCRSKGADINLEHPEKMFAKAVAFVSGIREQLVDGWTYRGEYLQQPKHNALAYTRIPTNHIVLFDINDCEEGYMPHSMVQDVASKLGFEPIPLIWQGTITEDGIGHINSMLERVSFLGGQKIEGVVIKSLELRGVDGRLLMGKHVSDAFREVHKGEWRKDNPRGKDIVELLVCKYRTPARWDKAAIHMQEEGALQGDPRDIGALMKGVQADIKEECGDEIKDAVFAWAWPQIARQVIRGLPEWYKQKLLEAQFQGLQ